MEKVTVNLAATAATLDRAILVTFLACVASSICFSPPHIFRSGRRNDVEKQNGRGSIFSFEIRVYMVVEA